MKQYDPVCGSDGVTYFSPCHAGCNDNFTADGMTKVPKQCNRLIDWLDSVLRRIGNISAILSESNYAILNRFMPPKNHLFPSFPFIQTYYDCSCANANIFNATSSAANKTVATSGECATSCDLVILFVFLLFLGMLCTLTTVTPVSMAILRYKSDIFPFVILCWHESLVHHAYTEYFLL